MGEEKLEFTLESDFGWFTGCVLTHIFEFLCGCKDSGPIFNFGENYSFLHFLLNFMAWKVTKHSK